MIRALLGRHGSLPATALVCVLLYVAAGLRYDGFFSPAVAAGFFTDNACLGIAAVGMTFVILCGGVDLSVGAVVGCSSITVAVLIEREAWHPLAAVALVLGLGTIFGASMGGLVHGLSLPPFIVTLAGMFLARGSGFLVSQESLAIRHPFHAALAGWPVSAGAIIFAAVLVGGVLIARHSRFGRHVYAVGAAPQSAFRMGVPVGRTTVQVYALSGFCASLAGVVYTLYTASGSPVAGTMLELDAIAAVVIGGTVLGGGVGRVAGTLLGVLIFGIIQTAIIFDGSLSSWWTRIAAGALLLSFILLQRLIDRFL